MLNKPASSSSSPQNTMGTPEADRFPREDCPKTSSASADTPNSAILNYPQVFLYDWWLIKANGDSHGRILGVGGLTSEGNRVTRCFASAPIIRRIDTVRLLTVDNIVVIVIGHLNRSRSRDNGFPLKVCDHFVIGFPYYWEDFSSLSSEGKEENSSAFTTPLRRSNIDIFDEMLRQQTGIETQRSGPLTRSRTRSRTRLGTYRGIT